MTSAEARHDAATALFSAFDLDGNGAVGLHELLQVMQSTRRVSDKKHQKRIRLLEAEIRQATETNKSTGTGRHALRSGGLVTFAQGAGEPSLDPEAFVNFIVGITKDDTAEEFEEFVAMARDAVDDALERTQGSGQRRAVWSMFQLLDVNQDGFVDMAELEVLLNVETKSDKKAVSKWRAVLSQRKLEAFSLAPTPASDVAANAPPNLSPEATVSSLASGNTDPSHLKLTLGDFQQFVQEFTDGNDAKVDELLRRVREAMQAEYSAYLESNRVNVILDAVLEDLIRERPADVLDGIIRSCERLKRTGTHGRAGLQRVQSSVTLRDFTSSAAGGGQRRSRAGSLAPATDSVTTSPQERPLPM